VPGPGWLGCVESDGVGRAVRLNGTLGGSSSGTADFPNELRFGCPATWTRDGSTVRTEIDAGAGAVVLAGHIADDVYAADVKSGHFELHRLGDWPVSSYRAVCRPYALADGRQISVHVNPDEWVGDPVLCYAEQTRVVRLYPTARGELVSEAGELFILPDSARGTGRMRRLLDGRSQQVTPRVFSSDEDIVIDGPAGRLAGTLMRPPGPGRHPAVVMIHGAAGGLRDSYRLYAEHFVRSGVAALVYDKRGFGSSTGTSKMTFADKAADAEAWFDHLRTRDDVRSDRVGVWGYSNGSWVAPLLAARRPEVAFLAVVGAAGTTGLETEIHRRAFDLREQGVPEDQIAGVVEQWRIVYELLDTRQPNPAVELRFDELARAARESPDLGRVRLHEYAIQVPFLGPVPPYATYQDLVTELPRHRAASDEWVTDPVDSYRKIRAPVLFLVGDNDSNLPGLVGARRVARALDEAGNVAATVLVLPETGHGMNVVHLGGAHGAHGITSEEAGYRFHAFRFAGGFVETVTAWAAARAAE
jgi:pimeloyl-ACP methyl ester carboxylesterase